MESTRINIDKFLENVQKGERQIGHERSEEAILLIGPSGSGKSTGIATLYKCRLEANVCNKTGDIIIDGDLPEGLKIESKVQAGTALPKKLMIKNKCFWDTPGFGDNKGAQQDLENSFYLRKIINTSKSIKFIFATMHSHLESRAKVFLDSLKLFSKAFSGNPQYLYSVGLLITNTPSQLNSSHIKNKLQMNILDSEKLELDDDSRKLLKHFVSNQDKIILMHTPIVGADLNYFYSGFRNDVFALTKKLKSISVPNPNLILSDETKNELPNIMNRKASGLEDTVRLAHQELKKCIDQSFSAVKFDSSLKLGISRVQQSKSLVDKFEIAKRNQSLEELYNIFSEFKLNLMQVELIKNTIELAEVFSKITPAINIGTYKGRIFNIPDNLRAYYQSLEAELQAKLRRYADEEFQKWQKDFQENSQINELEKKTKAIVNLMVESSKENTFKNFFTTLNTYGNLNSKIGLRNLDGVINTIKTFTEFVDEGNAGAELKNMQNGLINGYVSKFDTLNTHLRNRTTFTMNVTDIQFISFLSNPVHDPYNNQNNAPNSGCYEMSNLINDKNKLEEEIKDLQRQKNELTDYIQQNGVQPTYTNGQDYLNTQTSGKKKKNNNCNCSVFIVQETIFNNALLNYPLLQTQIRRKFGFKALNDLIELNLTENELNDAVLQDMFEEILGFNKAD